MSGQGRYAVLARLEAHHTFFADSSCPDLLFQPTKETAAALQRLGWLFRASAGGFDLLFQPGLWEGRKLGDQLPFLGFSFRARTADFVNYTALPESVPPSLLYFRGARDEAGMEGEAVELTPAAFEVSFDSPRSGLLVARDALGHEVWSETLHQARQALVDLRQSPAGCYSLSIGEEDLGRFYAADSLYREPPLGVVGLDTAEPASAAQRPAASPLSYDLLFRARATFWRYNLLGVSGRQAKELSIVDTGREVCHVVEQQISNSMNALQGTSHLCEKTPTDGVYRFSHVGPRTFPDGRQAQIFQSDLPVPLRAEPPYRFELRRGSDVLIARLGYPSMTLTGSFRGRLISDIYVANPLRRR